MKQRLTGIAALLAIAVLMVGLPWLFLVAATQTRIRFDLATAQGWWQALTTRDDGTLMAWLLIIVGTVAWAVLAVALIVEIISRLRHLSVPRIRGLGVPQMIAHGLVAAAIGAVVATSTITAPALATPSPVPAGDAGAAVHPAPQARPNTRPANDHHHGDTYVVKKGDTLWDIADDKLGNPRAYPEIFNASRRTVQPDGRRLADPDLIYPGWKLTLPDDDPPTKHRQTSAPDIQNRTVQPTVTATTNPTPASAAPAASASAPQTTPNAPTITTAQAEPTSAANADQDLSADGTAPLPWMLAGLGGSGALLAGSMWLWLRRRRAAQFRFRRPGRTITVPDDPAIAVVEKTLIHQGDLTSDLVNRIAQTTQRLAARLHGTGSPIPALLGIDVTHQHLTYRFTDPVHLPEPWEPDNDPREWRVRTDTDPDLIGPWDEEHEPVWPTLVTLGQDARGWRMANLETLGVLTLTGNQTNAEDLVRYWTAELSVSHWARDVEIAGADTIDGLPPLVRRNFWRGEPDRMIGQLITHATDHDQSVTRERLATIDAARAAQAGPELWLPRVLIARTEHDRLGELVAAVASHPCRTGITIIRLGGQAPPETGVEVRLTDTGRVQVPALGLDLVANGITADETAGCAALMDAAENSTVDAPMPDPAEPAADWQQHSDAAGHIHTDLVVPRDTATFAALQATSLLPEPDAVYVGRTANTVEDLAEIAPLVPAATTTIVKNSDPALDHDLAEWRADSSDRPRLSVLGHVRLRLGRGGQATVGAKRVAYYTEIAAYLATRPHGATNDELVEALGITADRVRVDLHTLRARLGINPTTDRYFVPKASDSTEAHDRNEGIYLIEHMLCDAGLFRRLRLRGEGSGAKGIDDLANALRLVTGAPYEQLRRRGGLWLADSRDDQHLLVAIVDVAHLLTTHALAAGDLRRARAAGELAHAVAPTEVTPQLDLAVIAEHEGDPNTADQIARDAADWLDGTGEGPMDVGQRADTILRAHRRLERKGLVG